MTDETGLQLGSVEAGEQKSFVATGAQLSVDDDAARVTLTFNRAASVLRLLGGGVAEKWDKYEACTTIAEMAAINADYKNDVNAKSEWKWKLPLLKDARYLLEEAGNVKTLKVNLPAATSVIGLAQLSSVEKAEISAPIATSIDSSVGNCNSLSSLIIFAPAATISWYFASGATALKTAKGDLSSLQKGSYAFSGCTSLMEVDIEFPSLDSAAGMLANTQLNKKSVLCVLRSIPEKTDENKHSLTIGIHVDLQKDEDVIAAIENAEAKGWTLTVQWNGKPTASGASTFALRRRTVWAKLGAPMEDGTQRLDWGHYVTDPSGYTEFASLEEAKEHFNITDEI